MKNLNQKGLLRNGQNENSNIINELKINYKQNSSDENIFPNKFTINLSKIQTNEFNLISFVKISRNDFEHPISSSNIYVTNEHNNINQFNESIKEVIFILSYYFYHLFILINENRILKCINKKMVKDLQH